MRKMALNSTSYAEKREMQDPKKLRFTQLDITPRFSDREHPTVIETVALIQSEQLEPSVLGDLTVHKDKEGVEWCENNRRLFVLRMAGVREVPVKLKSNDYMSRRLGEDKKKLNEPAFMPKIRGESSLVPPPSSSGPSVFQEEKGTSLLGGLGAVSAALMAGYWGWKLYNTHKDNDDDGNEKSG